MSVVQQELVWPSASWEEAEAFARCITDGIECAIDEGIIEAVVALNLLGLRTSQSCEGHLDYGTPYPWIDFETDEFPTFKQAQEDAAHKGLSAEEQEVRGAQLLVLAQSLPARSLLYTRLEELLRVYHEEHPAIPEEWRIIVDYRSPILFRMMPFCTYEAREWPEHARAGNLARGQAEMRALAGWLRERWYTMSSLAPEK